MNENAKLIICDLDGTLLNNMKEVTEPTLAALAAVKKQQGRICLASGRGAQMMSIYADAISGCDYVVACNGAYATYLPDRELVYCATMSRDTLSKLLTYTFRESLSFMMYTPDCIYYTQYPGQDLKKRVTDYEAKAAAAGFPVRLTAKPAESEQIAQTVERCLKLVVYEKDEQRMAAYSRYVETEVPDACCESTGYGLMGTFAGNVSKERAVRAVMEHMGVQPAQTYVFGDYENDLSMFACAENKIAMGNATEEVKEQATFVTKTNEEDGVAWYLEKILNDQ